MVRHVPALVMLLCQGSFLEWSRAEEAARLEDRPEGQRSRNPGRRPGARPVAQPCPWAFSVAAHLMVFAALFWPHTGPPPPHTEPPPILISLVELPKPEPPGLGPPGPPPRRKPRSVPPRKPSSRRRRACLCQRALARPHRRRSKTLSPRPPTLFPDRRADRARQGVRLDSSKGGNRGGGGETATSPGWCNRLPAAEPLWSRCAVGLRPGRSMVTWNSDWVQSADGTARRHRQAAKRSYGVRWHREPLHAPAVTDWCCGSGGRGNT